ncbi:ParB N-terminal domain-containing protein [Candidatus Minimicrobia naudis]
MTKSSHDPDQPRRFFDENALNELTESVREHGVVQPIEADAKRR